MENHDMNIIENTKDNVSVFELEGRVDSQGAVDLEVILEAAYQEGASRMILDLSEVTYLNSAGLRILADFLSRNRERKGDLLLVTPTPRIQRILQIIGFDKFFRVFDSVELETQAF
jgi:anti-anti-sigma factor